MKAGRILMAIAAVVFGATGLGYLLAPGVMLGVVGVTSSATTDFLLRTEGVALLAGAGQFWTLRRADPARLRSGLLILAAYCVLGSLVGLGAYRQSIVGPASVPSAIARFILAGVAVWVARRPLTADVPGGSSRRRVSSAGIATARLDRGPPLVWFTSR